MDIVSTFKQIAESLDLSFLCESIESANEVLDVFRRTCETLTAEGQTLPAMLLVLPTSGRLEFSQSGRLHDAPSAMVVLLDKMEFQERGEKCVEIAERLKGLAREVVEGVNISGVFSPITSSVNYRLAYNDFDGNFCALYLDMPLRSLRGDCIDFGA